jgi:hypothetical protein
MAAIGPSGPTCQVAPPEATLRFMKRLPIQVAQSPSCARARSNNYEGAGNQAQGTKRRIDMPLIQVVITLIVIGVLLGLVNRFIPMQSNIKSILNGVVVIGVVLWIVNLFGLFSSISKIHIGR